MVRSLAHPCFAESHSLCRPLCGEIRIARARFLEDLAHENQFIDADSGRRRLVGDDELCCCRSVVGEAQ